jgi:hypothetical protein
MKFLARFMQIKYLGRIYYEKRVEKMPGVDNLHCHVTRESNTDINGSRD